MTEKKKYITNLLRWQELAGAGEGGKLGQRRETKGKGLPAAIKWQSMVLLPAWRVGPALDDGEARSQNSAAARPTTDHQVALLFQSLLSA